MKVILLLTFLIWQSSNENDSIQYGKASYYASKFEGRITASGEVFSNDSLTAAHRNLPFGTKVKLINLDNDKSVVVRINDRGPFIEGRVIDVSQTVAKQLGFYNKGITDIKLEIIK